MTSGAMPLPVGHLQHQVFADVHRADACGACSVEGCNLQRDGQGAACGHGLNGVGAEIHHDLVNLGGIADECSPPGAQAAAQGGTSEQLRLQQVQGLANDRFHMHRDALAPAGAAEGEDSIHQRPSALARCDHAVQIVLQPSALCGLAQRPFAVAQNRCQDVVEVVSDAGGQRTHRFEALRLAQASFEPRPLLLVQLALVDVGDGAGHPVDLAGRIAQRHAALLEPARPIRQDDPELDVVSRRLAREVGFQWRFSCGCQAALR